MKIVKIILIVLVSIIALPLIIALFIPKEYTVSNTETINKPANEVFDYIKIIKNQEQYSVWVQQDPASVSYVGTDGTVGFIAKWDSKNENVGAGEQEITKITNERYDVDLRFKRPFEDQAKAATFVKAISPNQTLVTTEFYGKGKWPMNLMSLIGKKILHDAQAQNLKNLKTILEKQ